MRDAFISSLRSLAVFLIALTATSRALRADPPAAQSPEEQRQKLINFLSNNFPVMDKILDLYRARFVEAAPIFEAADVELPASLGGKPKTNGAATSPDTQTKSTASQSAPGSYTSPFREVHVEGSGHPQGAHFDPRPVLPSPISSVPEYTRRRAAYEKANIEAYYFYKSLREQQGGK